ncbi:translation elongation factor Ts [Candidatus Gracilibacteria bacterium]|nr:translation elongation factor Ts [Candidatus Gracilibacteria bacterium]
MVITAAQVKELRERTGIGMMECKKALTETDGDMDKAIEELRKKGLAKAAKKADREALEGGIKIEVEGNKAYIVSVACETDFLANSDKFKGMLSDLVKFLKENGDDKEATQEYINKNYALEMGENLQIKEFKVIEAPVLASYVHSNGKLAALLEAKEGTNEEVLKQVAMHVTAANPEYLSPADISDEIVEKEKALQLDIMKADPKMGEKPEQVLVKIIEGKMGKFKSEISLLEQNFVIDPSKKVKDVIGNDTIIAFHRLSI